MKLNQKFILREVAGDYVLVPIVNANDKFQGIISLNETGAFIWEKLENNYDIEKIVASLIEEYDVTKELAMKNANEFCSELIKLGILSDV